MFMTPERWQQVEDVFQAALERPASERDAFLSQACLGDEELAAETNSLIEAYGQAGEFLEEPAITLDPQVILSTREQNHIGQEIGTYQIVKRIGSGGMGEIYLARDQRLDRMVALKVLPRFFVSDEDRLRRFQTEARAASALNHTNILTIYEVGQAREISYIAAEYIDGPTIRERIRAGDLSLEEVLETIDQLLCGLTAAHAARIVHRDIKPENLMQRRDGVVKILDFGIAKLLERSPTENPSSSASCALTQTEVGVMLGTIGYMSPEQVRGLPIDERADIWSSGIVLYEMLAGRRPFDRKSDADTIVALLEREPEPPFGIDEPADRVLQQIQAVVYKALQKNPNARYQNAAHMRAELATVRQMLHGRDGSHATEAVSLRTNVNELANFAPRIASGPVPRKAWILISATLLVALFAGLIFLQRLGQADAKFSTGATAQKTYLQMSEPEQLAFVAEQEQRISAMMGDRPVKLNDEALRAIKTHVDRYVSRRESGSLKPGQESLRTVYSRAPVYIPIIARAFAQRRIPIVVGVYLPMIESEYKACFENEIGAKGLFQFLPSTAENYGVARSEMCDVQKVAPAAAHYIADRMAELGDDAQSMTLVMLSYNRGPDAVRDSLRRLREIDANYERNFWTLFANREKLDETFQKESAGYVPAFFAAAIIGENPERFDLQMPALTSLAKG